MRVYLLNVFWEGASVYHDSPPLFSNRAAAEATLVAWCRANTDVEGVPEDDGRVIDWYFRHHNDRYSLEERDVHDEPLPAGDVT